MPATITLSRDQMRSLMIDALQRTNQWGRHAQGIIAQLAIQRHPAPTPPVSNQSVQQMVYSSGFGQTQAQLDDRESAMANDIFWDLLVEGNVRPGLGENALNDQLPFFHFTDIGKQILAGREPSPLDPWKFLKRIRTEVPTVDPIIISYLTESLRTFQIGCYLASTVTLGCACEKSILLVIDATVAALPANDKPAFVKKTDGQMIKTAFDAFHKVLTDRIKPLLPREIRDQFEVDLPGIFSVIRKQRNAAGHPTGDPVEQSAAHSNLYTFPIFLRKVYELIGWLGSNTI